MFKSAALSLSAVMLVFASCALHADEMKGMENMHEHAPAENANVQIHKAHGIVNKINAEAGKVNITHDAIASMKWPKMTMDFTVKDKAGLAAIRPGMKVDFEIAMQGKAYHISRIVPAKE